MRDAVNLQTLRRSKSTKQNSIYKKAHRIMDENYSTPVVTDEEILNIAKDFPSIEVEVRMGGNIAVRSVKDSWMIRDEGRFYTLYHKGLFICKGRNKDSYHVQDVFRDLNYIFASIVSHDEYSMGIKKRNAYEINESLCG